MLLSHRKRTKNTICSNVDGPREDPRPGPLFEGNPVDEDTKRRVTDTPAFHFHALEKEVAAHSSVLAWRIPGMAEPGGLPSMR